MVFAALALKFLLANPDAAQKNIADAVGPGLVDVQSMKASFADLAKGIVTCYHHTARYRSADIVQRPWARQKQYGADKSVLVRIDYTGVTGQHYQMYVGILGKEKMIRTAVQSDTAAVPYSKRCELEQWVRA